MEVDLRIYVFISSLLPLPLTDTIRQWCISVAHDSILPGNMNEVIVLANMDSSLLDEDN